jgi:hypothetical protein
MTSGPEAGMNSRRGRSATYGRKENAGDSTDRQLALRCQCGSEKTEVL